MGNCYKSLCIQDFEVFKETLLEQKPSGVANVDKAALLALVFLYRSCRDFVGELWNSKSKLLSAETHWTPSSHALWIHSWRVYTDLARTALQLMCNRDHLNSNCSQKSCSLEKCLEAYNESIFLFNEKYELEGYIL